MKKHAVISSVVLASAVLLAGPLAAQEMKFFRIGTGGVGGTYYPIGGLIANAISAPPGSRECTKGGSCGVPGLAAIAQSANGSVANVNAIRSGTLESGFVQSDVAYWAYTGTGVFDGKEPFKKLRAIANLYPESIHLVARKGSGIKSVTDLKGKKVSLDEPGSGTLVDARIILEAFGLDEEEDIKAEYIKSTPASAKLKDGLLDAHFSVSGYPKSTVVDVTSTVGAYLVPIDGPVAEKILDKYQFFAKDTIPGDVYDGVGETPTLSVNAQWVVSADVDDDLVYEITRALWNEQSRKLLDNGHAKGKAIRPETALDGLAIPLHEGAKRYYREVGLLKVE